jgi:hypothetical protein
MTIADFTMLSLNEQALTTCKGGFIISRDRGKVMMVLYKLFDFYVDVYYRHSDYSIVQFKAFTSRKRLKLYFEMNLN